MMKLTLIVLSLTNRWYVRQLEPLRNVAELIGKIKKIEERAFP